MYAVGYDWKVLRFDSSVTIAFFHEHYLKFSFFLQICMIITGLGVHRHTRFDDFGVITGVRKKEVFLCSCHMSFKRCMVKKILKQIKIHCATGMYSREIINQLFSVSIFDC